MDWTINIPTLVGVASSILLVVIWMVKLGEKVAVNSTSIGELRELNRAAEEHIRELQDHKNSDHRDLRMEDAAIKAAVTVVAERINDVRLEAAQKYVTHDALNDIKREVIAEMQRVEKRIESQIDRAIGGTRREPKD